MKRKWIAIILSAGLLIAMTPGSVLATSAAAPLLIATTEGTSVNTPVGYTDLPAEVWAREAANSAKAYGLMSGSNDGSFGFGQTMTKAEFITVLSRMLGWQTISPDTPSFSDVAKEEWYYSAVETALSYQTIDQTETFAPTAPITREEMAVMLVRALGYDTLAQSVTSLPTPFSDVKSNTGYITVARDIGMTKGTSATTFSPAQTAKREEAAAMLVRVYQKYTSKTQWIHGFYAISSYSQKELIQNMDAVSLGWSRMSFDSVQGAHLNTTSAANNEFSIPSGYTDIATYLQGIAKPANLTVYADTSTRVETATGGSTDVCSAIMLDSAERTKAVKAIVNELTVPYSAIGSNPYSGVTIDIEGMKGSELKAGFNAFLTELSAALRPLGKTLYVAIPPATADGIYYDAYDFRTIGALSDKVILMAHDYHETTMPEHLLNSTYHHNTPLTPFASVYYGLKAITDENTGVEDHTKIALAISFNSVGWELKDGKVINSTSVNPPPATLYTRLKGGAQMGYSDLYRNPHITYTTEEGKEYFVWYEDERSISDKIALAKLFDVNGVSLWRIGNIPNYTDNGLYYNVMDHLGK